MRSHSCFLLTFRAARENIVAKTTEEAWLAKETEKHCERAGSAKGKGEKSKNNHGGTQAFES
jgi:hypothetical protein